jgi:hypothetical protein
MLKKKAKNKTEKKEEKKPADTVKNLCVLDFLLIIIILAY